MKTLNLIMLIILPAFFISCDTDSKKTIEAINNQNEKVYKVESSCTSKSIVVLVDKSKSMPGHSIPQPDKSDFKPLIENLRNCSGSLVVGLITANSDKVFVALRLLRKAPKKPKEPTKEQYPNDFDYRDAYEAYLNDINHYNDQVQEWKKYAKNKTENFESKLDELLKHPVNAMNTDIHQALNKAGVYHSNYPSFKPYTLLISDGKDDVGANLSNIKIGADIYLVYGSGSPTGEWSRKYDITHMGDLETTIYHILNSKNAGKVTK